jgi:tetratricopeptide (TPR) repeat protein
MEILEYRIGDGEASDEAMPKEYISMIGQYTNPKNRNVLDAQYIDGSISVDIMGRIMLALKEPDEQGRMFAKLSESIYFRFKADSMIIVEKVYAMKKLDEDVSIPEGIPDEYKVLTGRYIIFQLQKEFEVTWKDNQLAMFVPDVKEARVLNMTGTEGLWQDPVDHREYSFKTDPDGKVSGLDIYVTSILLKGSTAAWIVEKTIKEEGLDAALAKFREAWDNRALDLENTESDMNTLGYKYLNEGRNEEALAIFKINTETFPQSWNAYGSYGEALLKNGEKEEAIKNFEKSIQLNPDNENGRKMIEEIKNNK